MSDLSRENPTERFTGLADTYARHRPSYPAEAIDLIVQRCQLNGATLLIDVGCGTGISSRLFAARGIPVLGIEPNDEMRARSEAETQPGTVSPRYQKGCAEATGLPDGSAAAVLAAQAFHWFDGSATLREFHRILRPGGWVALMWNERDERDACTADYGRVMRSGPNAAAVEGTRGRSGDTLLGSSLFENAERINLHNRQELDEEGLLGRAFSASYAPRELAAVATFTAGLRAVFATHQRQGKVVLHYETSIYLGRRRELS
jgi:SAM-dependent methyltransferase